MVNAPHEDRSTGLVIAGLAEIAIGVLCALLIPLLLAGAAASRSLADPSAVPDLHGLVPSLLVYALIAAAFVWLGVGSIRARRWARAVMLSVAWIWLITGAIATAAVCLLAPSWSRVAAGSELPAGVMVAVVATTCLVVGVIYILMPLAFLLFYRSEHVAATCAARDPGPSWVDGCPQQLVTLVVLYASSAAILVVVPVYGFAFPLFNLIVDGWAGALAWAAVLMLLVVLVVGTARRDRRAWTLALAVSLAAAGSSTVHAATVPASAWLERVASTTGERQLLAGLGEPSPVIMAALALVIWATWILYLLSVRRHFEPPRAVRDGGP